MIKITCIIHSLSLGGMERVMALLINHFSTKENVEVSLILIGKTRQIDFQLNSGIKVYSPSFPFNSRQRTITTLKTIRFIRKTVKEIDPNTVLSFGEYWNNLVLMSLYNLNTPVFISDRSRPNKNLGEVQNFLRNKLYPNASGIIAQTERAREVAMKKGWNKNIQIIGNPIQEVEWQPESLKENIVLTVGRLIRKKHIDQLIRIFSDCDVPNWKLVIVGGNDERMNLIEEYRSLVKKMGLEHKIELVGTQKDVNRYYSNSKIFAFTSSSEGFPNVVGEAMSAGLPVIAYDCEAGPSDMIENGTEGYLIPLFDEGQFKEKLKILMLDKDKRIAMGENARQKIAKFAAEEIADKFYQFILNK
ncbi:glycosyltransferase family 4 protein [Aequorivita sp. H23M31]|uniref:Glycosyltransferase family 4 protein n=1 Tax=Aequorivita ciconiae TaxID=2494375 RepID=A0A410G1Z7_9FLAO|nr:glycosyltransferase [Aequorivita sp. H23M31]QAA81292.1 glycosyltransferase family 4 protein [Aequorivita sp. H23M31]